MSASVHAEPRHICPYCLKRFETKQGVEAHQKRKKHRVKDRHEDAPMEKEMRRYHDAKSCEAKKARAACSIPATGLGVGGT